MELKDNREIETTSSNISSYGFKSREDIEKMSYEEIMVYTKWMTEVMEGIINIGMKMKVENKNMTNSIGPVKEKESKVENSKTSDAKLKVAEAWGKVAEAAEKEADFYLEIAKLKLVPDLDGQLRHTTENKANATSTLIKAAEARQKEYEFSI